MRPTKFFLKNDPLSLSPMMFFIVLLTLLQSIRGESKILRSAGLYYTPDEQIEANTVFGYGTQDHSDTIYKIKTSVITSGFHFEHGFTEHFSWGSNIFYGVANQEIQMGALNIKENFDGLFDPEFFLKSHFETEIFRFHANQFFRVKADSMVLSYDHNPVNFSSGGSSYGIGLGAEVALDPFILGVEVNSDLWKDKQEVIEKTQSLGDITYFREGGQKSSASIFTELNNLSFIKPGIKVSTIQINESKTEILPNQAYNGTLVTNYKLPRSDQFLISAYGRVRLPGHFIINFEIYSLNSKSDTLNGPKNNESMGVLSNLGFKF